MPSASGGCSSRPGPPVSLACACPTPSSSLRMVGRHVKFPEQSRAAASATALKQLISSSIHSTDVTEASDEQGITNTTLLNAPDGPRSCMREK
ncbi:hypothetical protein E2P81_ATG06303 [Venturia nashicola]|uniref:Uncharacterized protein n=1 Tax=Venturia nashicola TaxID=86259 RepID=A0A4Z1NQQ8_9PEZI|nr:hypothetical protein E6O75_ATG06453 [Venturia nashicola]TLD27957.1 hypothetical protein E2P81_ATG06303 [Venturia nashicola]